MRKRQSDRESEKDTEKENRKIEGYNRNSKKRVQVKEKKGRRETLHVLSAKCTLGFYEMTKEVVLTKQEITFSII